MPVVKGFCTESGWFAYSEFRDMVRLSGEPKVLGSLDSTLAALTEKGLGLLETKRMSPIKGNLFELRPGDYRLFCLYDRSRDSFILLNGFRKDSAKTPEREKRIAWDLVDQYWKSIEAPCYAERSNAGNRCIDAGR